MRHRTIPGVLTRAAHAASVAVAAVCVAPLFAQAPRAAPAPQVVTEVGTITDVVIYSERAAVTRTIRRTLPQGVWAVQVTGLPRDVSQEDLQARVTAGGPAVADGATGPKLLEVAYTEELGTDATGTPEGIALAARIKAMQQEAADVANALHQAAQQMVIVERIGFRASATTANSGDAQPVHMEAVTQQLSFIAAQRQQLVETKRTLQVKGEEIQRTLAALLAQLTDSGAGSRTRRNAVVTIAQPHDGPVDIRLTYIVNDASWAPAYNIRATSDRTGVEIEYDADITQYTGEHWTDVRLTLCTAELRSFMAPPAIVPWYVDVYTPRPPAPIVLYQTISGASGGGDGGGSSRTTKLGVAARAAAIESLSAASTIDERGTAVAYELPRAITVPSDMESSHRTRIATIAPTAKFVYTAQPIVTQDVYLRGDMMNTSAFQLLPGTAQIFMGGDFVGETWMPTVSPKGAFKVFFGPDRAIQAKREVIAKTTGSAGFFGSNELTTWKYRVTIDNGTGKDATLELFDRQPVSRADKVEVKLENLSVPLSTDAPYVEGPKTQGILRWDLTVPANARNTNALPVTWSVLVSRPNNLPISPLPAD